MSDFSKEPHKALETSAGTGPGHNDAPASDPEKQELTHRSGFVGILGQPNAGKSTLFNRLLGQKLSIITHKAQTTRHRIQGFYSEEDCQIIFLDTPGIIQPAYLLQERMMDKVIRLRSDADLLLHIVDGWKQPDDSDIVYDTLRELNLPVMLIVNKMDTLTSDKAGEVLEAYWKRFNYIDGVAISALDGKGVDELIDKIKKWLPEGPAFFSKEEASDQSVRFFVSELIREQLFLLYQQEVPYSCAVNIAAFEEGEKMDRIHAEIVVNRNSQKGILIGKKGSMLKQLGIKSRQSIESFTGKKTHLELFVKVREKWRDNETFLKSYGYR